MDVMPASGADPFYYVTNFRRVLAWLSERCGDLLAGPERTFIEAFEQLPHASRAMLVRMLMRKGPLFRTGKLQYAEIGEPLAVCEPLISFGWVELDPPMSVDELFAVASKAELGALCDRFRLMCFGNLRQDWSEFVLTDLGVYRYETVIFDASSRAFQRRDDVDVYLALHACRQALDTVTDAAGVDAWLAQVCACPAGNSWLDTRRAKVLFRIGQHCERQRDWQRALLAYEASVWPDARYRRVRVLEALGRRDDALVLAAQAVHAPGSDGEAQRAARTLGRLQRARQSALHTIALLGCTGVHPPPPQPPKISCQPIPRSEWVLPMPDAPMRVEHVLRDQLHRTDAPVFYVENALINALFGLLCWRAVFAPIPGAFFHPFQRGPADLNAPEFVVRRRALFDACLHELDDGRYRRTIEDTFAAKAGILSPFVAWGELDDVLLGLALDCMPAAHLKLWFERLLCDVTRNCSGFPDLVRFVPATRSYELIEVEGPGDRLQDNQLRWLAYAGEHGLPVSVAHVRWAGHELCDCRSRVV